MEVATNCSGQAYLHISEYSMEYLINSAGELVALSLKNSKRAMDDEYALSWGFMDIFCQLQDLHSKLFAQLENPQCNLTVGNYKAEKINCLLENLLKLRKCREDSLKAIGIALAGSIILCKKLLDELQDKHFSDEIKLKEEVEAFTTEISLNCTRLSISTKDDSNLDTSLLFPTVGCEDYDDPVLLSMAMRIVEINSDKSSWDKEEYLITKCVLMVISQFLKLLVIFWKEDPDVSHSHRHQYQQLNISKCESTTSMYNTIFGTLLGLRHKTNDEKLCKLGRATYGLILMGYRLLQEKKSWLSDSFFTKAVANKVQCFSESQNCSTATSSKIVINTLVNATTIATIKNIIIDDDSDDEKLFWS